MRDPLIFSHVTPVANVYEYKLGQLVTQEKEKKMDNINATNNAAMVQAHDILDRTEPLTDEELDALLATSEFAQDAEDIAPEVESEQPTTH